MILNNFYKKFAYSTVKQTIKSNYFSAFQTNFMETRIIEIIFIREFKGFTSKLGKKKKDDYILNVSKIIKDVEKLFDKDYANKKGKETRKFIALFFKNII